MPLSLLFWSQVDWQLALFPQITVFRQIHCRHSVEGKPKIFCVTSDHFPACPNSRPKHVTKSRGFRTEKWKQSPLVSGCSLFSATSWRQPCSRTISVDPAPSDELTLADSLRPHSRICWGISHSFSCLGKGWKNLLSPNHHPRYGSSPGLVFVSPLNTRSLLPLVMVLLMYPRLARLPEGRNWFMMVMGVGSGATFTSCKDFKKLFHLSLPWFSHL